MEDDQMKFKRATELNEGDMINHTGTKIIKHMIGSTASSVSYLVSNPDDGSDKVMDFVPWRLVSIFGKK